MSQVRSQHLSEGDESYFVSMTDLMVGMLFVFIIMLMAFALNLRDAQQTQEKINAEQTGARKARDRMLEDIQRSLEAKGVRVEIDRENGVLRLKADLLFDKAKAELTDTGRSIISHVADALQEVLPCYANLPGMVRSELCPTFKGGRLEAVFIEGHTDSDPFPANYKMNNWTLSAERAITTFRAIIDGHSDLDAIRNDASEHLIGVSGYESRRPTAPVPGQTPEEKKRADRRIDLRFIMSSPKPPPQSDTETALGKSRQ